MSRHDDMVSMRHMLDHAAEAMEMARGRCREDLDRDRKLSLALMRLLEVVGEAAGRVSPATRAAHSAVAWSKIIGLRNRLIHGYDQVDYDVLWRIIGEDLPPLVAELERILGTKANLPDPRA